VPTPPIGGVLIYINFIFFLCYLFFLWEPYSHSLFGIFSYKQFVLVLTAFSMIFFLGLYDDKYPIKSNHKLFFQFIIIFCLVFFDPNLSISKIKFFNIWEISLNRLSILFTVICVLFYINSMNMFDGMNMLSIIFYVFLTLFFIVNNFYNIFCYTLLISLIFFAFLNFNGRSFLGDAGSLLLGLLSSYIFIKNYNFGNYDLLENFLCYLVFPCLDSLRLFIARLKINQHIFTADREHLHHHLLNKVGYKKTMIIYISIYSFVFLLTFLNFFSGFQNLLLFVSLYFLIVFYTKKNSY